MYVEVQRRIVYRAHLLPKRRRGRDRTVVGLISTYAISAFQH